MAAAAAGGPADILREALLHTRLLADTLPQELFEDAFPARHRFVFLFLSLFFLILFILFLSLCVLLSLF